MAKAGHEHPLARALARARDEHVAEVGNLPFFTAPPRAKAAALLVHGFTASPWEMRPVATDLERRGYACLAVRLPGHGTTPGDLAKRRWEEWDATVTQAFDLLTERFGRVYGVGLSTGALLLLALALQRQPAGVVLLSPYLRLQHRLAPFAGWLRFVYPYQKRSSVPESPYFYNCRPLAGVHQINRLVRHLSPSLHRITAPVLAVHGEGDQTVDIDSGRELVERMGSTVKVYERLGTDAPHVLTDGSNPHRRAVFELVGQFLEDMEGQRCDAESR